MNNDAYSNIKGQRGKKCYKKNPLPSQKSNPKDEEDYWPEEPEENIFEEIKEIPKRRD